MILFDLLPYVFLLLLTVLIPKLSKQALIILFVVFFVFSGFRYGVGWDYFNYIEAIEYGGWMIDRMEFLPRQLMTFCNNHRLTQTFYIVTSFFTIFCYFFMISKSSINPAISLVVFLCVPSFFLDSLSIVRFSLAVSIVFMACYYGYNKKRLLFFILLFVAILVHNAALFGLLVIPFVLKETKWGFITNIVVFLLSFFVGTVLGSLSFFESIFNGLNDTLFADVVSGAEKYMYDKGNVGFSRTPYVFALFNLINLFSFKRLVPNDNDNRLQHYVTMFNIGCSLLFIFSFNSVFAGRVSQFFLVFLILIVPYYKKNKMISLQLIAFYSIFVFIFFFQLTIKANNSDFIGRLNCWLPYRMNFGL